MAYKFEDKLRRRAEQFIEQIKAADFRGVVVEDSFRDYTVKVAISSNGADLGKVNLYYSPRSDSFSLKTHGLKDESIRARLEECWLESNPDEGRPDKGRSHKGRSHKG